MPFHFDMLLVDFYFRSKQNSKGNMPKNSNSHIVKPYDSAFHPVYRTEPVLVRLSTFSFGAKDGAGDGPARS